MSKSKKPNVVDKETGEVFYPDLESIPSHVVMPVIRTPYNAHLLPKHHEVNKKPSNTVPDQTLSITQILDRYQRGLTLDVTLQTATYSDEANPEIPDFNRMDLIDKEQLLIAQRARVREIEEQLQKQVKIKKDNETAAARKQQELDIRKKLKEEQDEQNRFRNSDQGTKP